MEVYQCSGSGELGTSGNHGEHGLSASVTDQQLTLDLERARTSAIPVAWIASRLLKKLTRGHRSTMIEVKIKLTMPTVATESILRKVEKGIWYYRLLFNFL